MDSIDLGCEWLQTNRYGSFAMGTIDRIPRRKYHSLMCIREPGFGDPLNAVMDIGEYLEVDNSLYMLHAFEFSDRTEPKGFKHLKDFSFRPNPQWIYDVAGVKLERTLNFDDKRDIVRLHYSFRGITQPIRLRLRPFVACRSMHALTQENPFLNGGAREEAHNAVSFQFYEALPRVFMRVSGHDYHFNPQGGWVNSLCYNTERARGYPFSEDLYFPGDFEVTLSEDVSIVFELSTESLEKVPKEGPMSLPKPAPLSSFVNKLEWAGEQYLITTKKGFHSVIAGYPWFGHWGRDTFISLPGLCLESGDPAEVREAMTILQGYGDLIVDGLTKTGIVCAFPEKGLIMTGIDTPLLYIRAVQMLRELSPTSGYGEFMPVVCRILNALRKGADQRVNVSVDGGLWVQPGPWAVTWMDVLKDGQPVTPRAGFAVDINALFFNAVHFALDWAEVHDVSFARDWAPVLEKAQQFFVRRFWSEERGYLADSHNGHVADFSLRPNQLWALALPNSPISREAGARILEVVKKELVTPVGLRTLARSDSRYQGSYRGSHGERDSAYHQGTVWPWLIGIYADALYKVHGASRMKEEISPILKRLATHLDQEACLGQISEVFDGDAPHSPGGAPAQAWSVAEILRIAKRMTL
ncbi:MAG TPA: amylo-alpha-1,6-glucosidase [Bdellovibrionota bacterium]|nr:amylo-alpha-1,6-glucosidase [Bdellovibrionota bacterium]